MIKGENIVKWIKGEKDKLVRSLERMEEE